LAEEKLSRTRGFFDSISQEATFLGPVRFVYFDGFSGRHPFQQKSFNPGLFFAPLFLSD
jgi:hypothetical protein